MNNPSGLFLHVIHALRVIISSQESSKSLTNKIDPIIAAAFDINYKSINRIVKEAKKRPNIYVMLYDESARGWIRTERFNITDEASLASKECIVFIDGLKRFFTTYYTSLIHSSLVSINSSITTITMARGISSAK